MREMFIDSPQLWQPWNNMPQGRGGLHGAGGERVRRAGEWTVLGALLHAKEHRPGEGGGGQMYFLFKRVPTIKPCLKPGFLFKKSHSSACEYSSCSNVSKYRYLALIITPFRAGVIGSPE